MFEQDDVAAARIRDVWTTSRFGWRGAAPKERVIKAVADVAAQFELIAEIGAGDFASAEAWREMGLTVQASDIPGHRLEAARTRYPHLDIYAEDAVTMAQRLNGRRALFVAINVLGNLTPFEVNAFFDLAPAVWFVSRGLSPDSPELSRPRKKIGFDHNYERMLTGKNMARVSGGLVNGSTYVGMFQTNVTALMR